MNLQWFPLHIEAYTGDTMHLTTEEHGAYLLMMLAYYRTQEPLPASDRSLAALTKLPMDRWLEAKPALARFFSERNGRWVHDRIEAEIAEAKRKHAETIARVTAAAQARYAKKHPTRTPSRKHGASTADARRMQDELQDGMQTKEVKSAASSKMDSITDAARTSSRMQDASIMEKTSDADAGCNPSRMQDEVRHASTDASTSTSTYYSLSGSENGSGEGKDAGGNVEEAADAPDADPLADAMGTPIPDGWRPTLGKLQQCQADGATEEEIEKEIATFVYDKQASGAFSHDWNASFGKWWERFKSYKAKQEAKKPKAAPRVEVNTKPDWPSIVKRWKRNNSLWPRGVGTEPGMINCQCPPEVLIAHGIDPKTGLNLPDQSDTTAKAAT